MSLDAFTSVLLSGLVLSSLYALLASGLSLVWTTLGIFNFAHGVLMAVGAYVTWQISQSIGETYWIGYSIALMIVVMVMLGAVLEYVLIRPFYGNKNIVLVTVMTTLAGLTFLENGIQAVWGPRLKQLPPLIEGNISIHGLLTLSAHEAVIIVVSPLILIGLYYFLNYSIIGKSIRAVGQNQKAAKLMGINVSRSFILTFGLAAALTGIAGAFYGGLRLMNPTMGSEPLVKALIVVIFGGLGNISGTIAAAYLIGFLEAFLIYFIGLYWTPSLLFLFMIFVLIFRHEGLFGDSARTTT